MDRVKLLINLLKAKRKGVALIIAGSLVLSVIAFFAQTRIYKAEATIMPLKNSSSSLSAVLGMFGSIPVEPSFLRNFGNSDNDRLMAILKSETIALNTIQSLDLLPLLFPKKWDEKSKKWKNEKKQPHPKEAAKIFQEDVLRLKESEQGTILIQVKFKDPKIAANIANQLLKELDGFINQSSFSVAKKNREFLEARLEEAKKELGASEEDFKNFQEQTGIILLDSQTEAMIELVAQLEAQKVAREVELGVLTQIASDAAPKVQLLKDELKALDKKIKEFTEGTQSKDNLLPSLKKSPSLGIEYVQKKRDLLIKEKIFELLTQQYELARIEENRELIAFEVLDKPLVPHKPCWPILWINLAVGLFVSSLLSLAYLLIPMNANSEEKDGKSASSRVPNQTERTKGYIH